MFLKKYFITSLIIYLPLPVLCEDWEASWASILLRCCFNVAISFWAFFNSSFVLLWRFVSVSSCLFVSKSWTYKKKHINPTNTVFRFLNNLRFKLIFLQICKTLAKTELEKPDLPSHLKQPLPSKQMNKQNRTQHMKQFYNDG